ncbi:PAS domain S-box protein [uncultured Desulfobulbus sp.]|uniref:PAS domain S-box protein n=1 Tax=uncultured Desulfobulbus sp. TaxID=239745 RepID=UPI0029C8B63F|nr:PAS domain S-box protein [uncultured Desulfobulbus sp.]
MLLIRADYIFLRGTVTFQWLLVLRIGLTGLSVWAGAVAWRTSDPDRFDQWSFLWAMACALANNMIILSRPATYTGHVIIELFIIIALYAVQPGLGYRRILPPLFLSLSSLYLYFTVKVAMGYVASLSTVSAYIGANTIGWLVAANWFRYRRESFFANETLEKLYRQAEAGRLAAEVSERAWERIIDTSPDMLFVIDKQHCITRVNHTFAERLGINRREALGRRCCDLLCGFASLPEFCLLHKILRNRQPHTIEARFLPLGIDSRIMAAPLFDQFGDHEATVFIIEDITEQKHSEQKLKSTQEQYRSLVQNSHGIIYTIRPDGVITYASPSYTKLVGYDPTFIVGKQFQDVVHPDDIQACEAFQREILESGESRSRIEYRIFHRDGSLRWHLSIFTPCRDEEGRIHSFVGNAIDITELKHSQFELGAACKVAEKANNTKSEFLAMISHEIRTPLNAMVGFSALACQTTDVAMLKEYVNILDRSSRLLMDLVNNILDMSKAEAGQLHLDPIPFSLLDAIDLLQWQYVPVANQKKIKFTVVKEQDLPIWINGDPLRFRQIVSNLLSNAMKFTETGQVVLSISAPKSHSQDEGCLIRLEIQDTGIGIEEANLTLMFQPFLQLNPGTTRKYGGSGLGLAIVQGLVDLMKGHIEVTSQVGRGSCFTVELPFFPATPPQHKEITGLNAESLEILVVEDNAFNRRLLRDTLRTWGHEITEAESAMQALELLDVSRYDCVILDIRMPDVDGVELTRRLRQLERLSNLEPTPIIAYTADMEGTTTEQCLAAGMQAVLFKPLDARLLALALDKHCRPTVGGQKPASPQSLPSLGLADRTQADMEHDPQRIRAYLQLLREDIESELNRLDQAIILEDRILFKEAAHSLKGLCGYLQGRRPGDLALKLHESASTLSFCKLHDLAKQLRSVSPWCGPDA